MSDTEMKVRARPLRVHLAAVILMVILPTLAVVAFALLNAGESYRNGSLSRLNETAHVIAQSVQSELVATGRMISGYALMLRNPGERTQNDSARWLSGTFGNAQVHRVFARRSASEAFITKGSGLAVIDQLALKAVSEYEPRISNLLTGPDFDGAPLRVALATITDIDENGVIEVDVLVADPRELTRTLTRAGEVAGPAVLAITDGTGRVIGRSRDADRFLGKPVPDWKRLQDLGTDDGAFRARTIEGGQIVFAFRKIAGTPGWVAVVGEPAESFDSRWQKPLAILAAAAAVTFLVVSFLAWRLIRNILKPVRQLAEHAERVADAREDGTAEDITPSVVAEFETLRQRFAASEAELRHRIAESRAAECAAEANLAAMRRAERMARIGSWSLDLETGTFSPSEMLYELTGVDPKGPPFTMDRLQELAQPEDFARIQAAARQSLETGEPYSLEVMHPRVNGPYFPAYLRGAPVFDAKGKLAGLAGTVQDLSERHEEQARLAVLADNLPSGYMFRLEGKGDDGPCISYVSAGVETLTGISAAELLNDPDCFLKAVVSADRDGLAQALETLVTAGEHLEHEFRLMTRDGRLIWLQVRAARHILLDGRTVWDGIMLDITDEKAAARALEAARDAAERAGRAKSDFLATMSHEIRTPMNAVIGMTRLTLQTDLSPKQRNYLEKIDSSARVLLNIINDILDFSRIEAGGLALEHTEFAVETVLETVSAITAVRAEEKELEVVFSVAPGVPVHVLGDPLRLGQVLTNLVGNAIKFTGKGEVVVTVEPVPASEPPKLRFSVRDTGIGLDAEQVSRLFRPFTQAESATARKFGGTGLGLAISKRLVELMGGQIGVESEPGKGSVFSFTIEAVPAPAPVPELPPSAANPLMNRRVLIVDDNESARVVLADMVRDLGLKVETCEGGREALALLHERAAAGESFDIVLMDWRMPHLDGLETAGRLRADASLAQLPAILMVTAYGREEILRGAERIGLQGVLIKPVTQSVMYNTLMAALVKADQSDAETLPARESADLRVAQLLGGRRVLVADDNALNREIATDFLEAVGIEVETVENGAEVLDVLGRKDFDAVLLDVHMPVMDGLAAARAIRRQPRWHDLPLVSLTAQASKEDRLASLAAGISVHLTKPIDEQELYRTLIAVLGLEVPFDAIPNAGSASEAPSLETGHNLHLPAILKRFGGNRTRVRRLLDGFARDFADVPCRLDALSGAMDFDGIAMLAHQVKGSAGYLEAQHLCLLAQQLEEAARQKDRETVEPHVAAFRTGFAALLASVRETSQSLSLVAGEGASDDDVKSLILAAMPLVQNGDYAAISLLELISERLVDRGERELAIRAQACFEDLELQDALAALETLVSRRGNP